MKTKQPNGDTMEKTINTSKIEQAITHLMNVVDEELGKHEPKAYDELVDIINKKMGDDIYQSNAGLLMDFVYELSEPDYKAKRLSLGGALFHANDEAITLLENLTNLAITLHKYLESGSHDTAVINVVANEVKYYADKVQGEVVSELYERVHGYRKDIEKLTNGSVHA